MRSAVKFIKVWKMIDFKWKLSIKKDFIINKYKINNKELSKDKNIMKLSENVKRKEKKRKEKLCK